MLFPQRAFWSSARYATAMLSAVLVACSSPGVAANGADAAATPSSTKPSSTNKEAAMSSQHCANDSLSRSACMITLILDDLKAHFGGMDGGGIAEIKAASSTSYTVSLPREERIQILTYEFDVKADTVSLKHRGESTKSF